MKSIYFLLILLTLFIAGCGAQQMALYDDLAKNTDWGDLENTVLINYQVNYIDNGAVLTVILNSNEVKAFAGQLSYDEKAFDIDFKQISQGLCKFNLENNRVSCASTTPFGKGESFKFTLKAKNNAAPGNYPLNFKVDDVDGKNYDSEINTFIGVN